MFMSEHTSVDNEDESIFLAALKVQTLRDLGSGLSFLTSTVIFFGGSMSFWVKVLVGEANATPSPVSASRTTTEN